jgi:hypothetical protein
MNIWDLKEDIIDTNKFCVMLDDLNNKIDSLSIEDIRSAIKGISIMLSIHIDKTASTFTEVITNNGRVVEDMAL